MATVNHIETALPSVNTNNNDQTMTLVAKSLVPSTWDSDVREISFGERREAGLALAHSFATDPLSLYLLGGEDTSGWPDPKKWNMHVRIMRYTYASYRYHGIATVIGADYDALALWMPPGTTNDDWHSTLLSGTWRLHYQLPRESRKRLFGELFPALHDTKAEIMGDRNNNCYYLGYIGTKACARRKGYATRLLRHMTDKADAENRAMYLESSSETNNPFYEKFGFVIKKEIVLQRGPHPVKLYCMIREPQISKTNSSMDLA